MEEKKSFWTTLPGILTGIASVLAALGGLIGAWYQFVHTVPKEPAVASHIEEPKKPFPPTSYKEPTKPGPEKTGITPAPSTPQKYAVAMPAAPKLSTLKVMVDFERGSEIRAGGDNLIKVLALSPDGKAVVKEGKVIIKASGGFFQDSGSEEIKGTTDMYGKFETWWYTHENLLPKGETNIIFDAVVTKEGEKGSGKGSIVVTKE